MKVGLNLVNLQAKKAEGCEVAKSYGNANTASNTSFEGVSRASASSIKNSSGVKNFSPIKTNSSTTITFTGAGKNTKEVLHIAPEGIICKGGGVGTVLGDWAKSFPDFGDKDIQHNILIPYYNGDIVPFDDGEGIKELKPVDFGGKKYFVNNATDIGLLDLEKELNKTVFELEEVVGGKMKQFDEAAGDIVDQGYKLYEVKNLPAKMLHSAEGSKPTKVFTMFTPMTASMPKQYGFSYKNGEMYEAYSEFAKASANALPAWTEKTGFNPGNVVVHDYHANAALKFIQEGASEGNDYYKDIRLGYIFHNAGKGYQGDEVSPQSLFRALAKPEEYKKVVKSKQYADIMLGSTKDRNANLDKFFAELMPNLCEKGADGKMTTKLNPSLIPMRLAEKGYVNIATVSGAYAEEVGRISEMSQGLTTEMKELYESGQIKGVLNGLFAPNKEGQIFSELYNENAFGKLKTKVDGNEVPLVLKYKDGTPVQPFKAFDPNNIDIKEIQEAKRANKFNLIERIVKHDDVEVPSNWGGGKTALITGNTGKNVKLHSLLNEDTLKNLKANPDTSLFVSWGRGDFQKSFDEILEGIKKQVTSKKDDGKSLFVICGGLDKANPEGAIVQNKIDELMKMPQLKGRFAYLDGWGPADALASAADWSIFPSRTAPCELTPLEAQIRGSLTIASNTGGLKQTTISLAEDAKNATGIKTNSLYYTAPEKLAEHSTYGAAYKADYDKLVKAQQKLIDNAQSKYNRLGININNAESADAKVLKSPEYQAILRKYRDAIMSDEIADGIDSAIKTSSEDKAKMIVNAVSKKVGWADNKTVNNGESAFEIYTKYFFGNHSAEGIPEAPKDFSFIDKTKLNGLIEFASNAGETVASSGNTASANINTKDLAEAIQANTKANQEGFERLGNIIRNSEGTNSILSFLGTQKGKIGLAVGAAAVVVGGAWAYISKANDKKEEAKEDKMKAAEYTPSAPVYNQPQTAPQIEVQAPAPSAPQSSFDNYLIKK